MHPPRQQRPAQRCAGCPLVLPPKHSTAASSGWVGTHQPCPQALTPPHLEEGCCLDLLLGHRAPKQVVHHGRIHRLGHLGRHDGCARRGCAAAGGRGRQGWGECSCGQAAGGGGGSAGGAVPTTGQVMDRVACDRVRHRCHAHRLGVTRSRARLPGAPAGLRGRLQRPSLTCGRLAASACRRLCRGASGWVGNERRSAPGLPASSKSLESPARRSELPQAADQARGGGIALPWRRRSVVMGWSHGEPLSAVWACLPRLHQ